MFDSEIPIENYIAICAEIERLTMINRELIKENNSIISRERVFPFKKVEQLLLVNEKLRILLEKSKDRKQASNDFSCRELPEIF